MKESEYLTRKKRIDPRLEAAGWNVVPFDSSKDLSSYHQCAIEEYPTENGPADYALCLNGLIIGVVEAKKVSLGPQNVLTQAERYAKGVPDNPFNFDGLRVPFLFSTNGEVFWYHDVRQPLNRSRRISGFHTPDALLERLNASHSDSCKAFFAVPDNHMMRYYQCEASNAVGQGIAENKHTMMLAMATGTGKTYTVVNLIYRLMKAGVAKRILFLVDRRALATQAVRAFSSFETEQGLKFDRTACVASALRSTRKRMRFATPAFISR